MAETPTSDLALAFDAGRTLIAGCAMFQTWTGTASTAAAKARVYGGIEINPTRPCVYLGWPEGKCKRGGYLGLTFRALVEAEPAAAYRADGAEATDFISAYYEFVDAVGQIMEEMMAQAEPGGGYSLPGGIDFRSVGRTDKDDQADYHQMILTFQFGLMGDR